MVVRQVASDEDIARCFTVMRQLRMHLEADTFVARVRQMEQGGYRLVYLEEAGAIRAVAGYRVLEMLSRGRFLYVDDLVADEAFRSRGFGKRLFDWLIEAAKAAGCAQIDLDSSVQRAAAHRFYSREQMRLASYHFTRAVEGR